MEKLKLVWCVVLLAASLHIGGVPGSCQILVLPSEVHFDLPADQPLDEFMYQPAAIVQYVSIGATTGLSKVPFQFSAAQVANEKAPNFILVSPAAGVSPASVQVSLNLHIVPYLPPGVYTLGLGFNSTDPAHPGGGGAFVILNLHGPPPPSILAVVSSASQFGGISPGQLVTIYGSNLGNALPPCGQCTLPTTLGRTTVTFSGILAPLLYVSPSQINAVVPFGTPYSALQPGTVATSQVVVTHNGIASDPLTVPIAATSPGIFTVAPTGRGQGAIGNVDPLTGAVTPNSSTSPAPRGSVIVLYATGAGRFNQSPGDGAMITNALDLPYYLPASASLMIGGQPAAILYAGAAPNQVAGVLQVNAVVPAGIGSGAQPVVLTVGSGDNAAQGVTVAVQ